MPTYTRFNVALRSGKGATAVGVDGKKYLDFGSGIGVNALGYSDEGWVRAVSGQAALLSHTSNLYYSPVQAELAGLLCSLTGFGAAFLANSGAEANEGMIKLARKYSFDRYGDGRSVVVTLKNSFHGRTVTTLSATGQEEFHRYFFPFTCGFRFAEPNDFGSVKEACKGDVCGILLEAVQGEGGVYPLDPDFVRQTAEFAKENDILLMFDEVQTGVGRTGRLFAYEHYGVSPDAISSAKALGGGLPMGAVLCSERLKEVMGPGSHGSTFGGNPIACAGAIEVLSRVSKPEFLIKVNEKALYFRKKLAEIKDVARIRGLGLMIGFEVDGVDSKQAAAKLSENGLLVLTAKKALRLLPPLVITKDEIDRGIEILKTVFAELKHTEG
ncbi:MAG TPA: aspartate aminotransferase family protein [Clostridia bacterium]|nr:aspartate aminotransferase family protein [Clostridia bacterium]